MSEIRLPHIKTSGDSTTGFPTATRGTTAYTTALGILAMTTREGYIMRGVRSLWKNYGWRGLVDFQEILLTDLHTRAPLSRRNPLGAVRLDTLMVAELSEEDVLENAVTFAHQSCDEVCGGACGYGPPATFADSYERSLRYSRTARDHYLSWQKALDALARNASQEVWPILARTPGIRDTSSAGHYERWASYLLAMCRTTVVTGCSCGEHTGDHGGGLESLVQLYHP